MYTWYYLSLFLIPLVSSLFFSLPLSHTHIPYHECVVMKLYQKMHDMSDKCNIWALKVISKYTSCKKEIKLIYYPLIQTLIMTYNDKIIVFDRQALSWTLATGPQNWWNSLQSVGLSVALWYVCCCTLLFFCCTWNMCAVYVFYKCLIIKIHLHLMII